MIGDPSVSLEDLDDIFFEINKRYALYKYPNDAKAAMFLKNKIERYNYMQAYFKTYAEFYIKTLDDVLRDEIEVSLVLYDEVEYFRPWSHPLFSYPYIQRKNIILKSNLQISIAEDGDYKLWKVDIKMKQSHVCLEPSWAAQLNFLSKFKEEAVKIFNKQIYGIEPEIDNDCDGEAFMKVKYSSS